ncbi:MAG: hypothetical protein AMXMBFR48_25010 [Ignavibacteriales bacterium]
MISTIYIPREERLAQKDLIRRIAEAVYDSEEKISFMEEFVPPGGRVPHPQAELFAQYLSMDPRQLWAVSYKKQVVGFILIADIPHRNAVGFGIDCRYANCGIMSHAFTLIKSSPEIRFPLYGYTSQRNIAVHRLLKKLGFLLTDESVLFLGEPAFGFVLNNP